MTAIAPPTSARSATLQSALEKNGIQFQLKAGGAKYICTIKDRNSHERQKAERTPSSESIGSGNDASAPTASTSTSTSPSLVASEPTPSTRSLAPSPSASSSHASSSKDAH